MKPTWSKKNFAVLGLLLVVASTFLFGSVAQAQFEPVVPSVPVNDSVGNEWLKEATYGLGVGGALNPYNATETIVDETTKKALAACDKTIKAVRTAQGINKVLQDAVQKTGFWLSLIGGGGFEASSLTVEIKTLEKELGCINLQISVLQKKPIQTVLGGQELQREQALYERAKAAIEQRLETLNARTSAGWKGMAKALMVRTLLSLNKSLTTRVVNDLVQKYKIDDYLAYGDAVATQVYAMKYIDQNYQGDPRTQMMMRSLIQSEKVPEQARVAASFANQQAKQYMGSACSGVGQLDAQNPDSLHCLSAMGQVEASPTYRYLKAVDMAGQVKGEAVKTAQAEISQSDGYAPPRDCSDSLSQQKQLDAKIQATASEAEAAEAVLDKLNEALKSGQTTQAEVDKAQAAFYAADTKLVELPQEIDTPVIDICKAIDSPGKFVAGSVQKFLDQHLEQASQMQSDNLPAYMTFMSDMASNFLTNLLTGGKSSSKVFKEAGLQGLNNAVGSASQSQAPTLPDSFPDDDSTQDHSGGSPAPPPGEVNGASIINFNPRGSVTVSFRPH